jgi:hypothetical protein
MLLDLMGRRRVMQLYLVEHPSQALDRLHTRCSGNIMADSLLSAACPLRNIMVDPLLSVASPPRNVMVDPLLSAASPLRNIMADPLLSTGLPSALSASPGRRSLPNNFRQP